MGAVHNICLLMFMLIAAFRPSQGGGTHEEHHRNRPAGTGENTSVGRQLTAHEGGGCLFATAGNRSHTQQQMQEEELQAVTVPAAHSSRCLLCFFSVSEDAALLVVALTCALSLCTTPAGGQDNKAQCVLCSSEVIGLPVWSHTQHTTQGQTLSCVCTPDLMSLLAAAAAAAAITAAD